MPLIGGNSIISASQSKYQYSGLQYKKAYLKISLFWTGLSHLSYKSLKPLLVKEGSKPKGEIVIGTVKGDLHDIGKNIVSTMFESAAFKVTDLGIDVSPERFVQAIRKVRPQIVAMSCLLTTTMNSMRETIDKIREEGLRNSVTIMVGGPPISEKFADEIGADFYGENAYHGVQAARQCVGS